MRVVIAPDSFGGTLSAREAVDAITNGWRCAGDAGNEELIGVAMSDGGPGFVEVVAAGLSRTGSDGVQTLLATVSGPLGEPVPITIVMADEVAYVESAQACGLHLMSLQERDP